MKGCDLFAEGLEGRCGGGEGALAEGGVEGAEESVHC